MTRIITIPKPTYALPTARPRIKPRLLPHLGPRGIVKPKITPRILPTPVSGLLKPRKPAGLSGLKSTTSTLTHAKVSNLLGQTHVGRKPSMNPVTTVTKSPSQLTGISTTKQKPTGAPVKAPSSMQAKAPGLHNVNPYKGMKVKKINPLKPQRAAKAIMPRNIKPITNFAHFRPPSM